MSIPEPLRVLNMFRSGLDTVDIAERLGVSEAVVWRLLDSGEALDFVQRQARHD